MLATLDVDLLKTFIAIADTGSFTRAADEVGRTQSAVSMQVRRLEETLGRELFSRDGRQSRLTPDGEKLLEYARRLTRLNDETIAAFREPEVQGKVRFGTPDDYAEFLPDILAAFARTHPLVQVDVECYSSRLLSEMVRKGQLDLSMVTISCDVSADQVIRREPLIWVSSLRHRVHEQPVVPIAISHIGCGWRSMAIEALEAAEKSYRIAYASPNSNAVIGAVNAGLAVGAIPEICLRPGLRRLGPDEGFPPLGSFEIGLIRAQHATGSAIDALAGHISEALVQPAKLRLVAAE
ncbi:MAG: LysR family transcriptional regulator [Hyphomicrobiales bacterium]